MNALEQIKEKYPDMSGIEKRIADIILQDPSQVVDMTVRYLAQSAGVSDGSIINFANSVGYEGFTKLKIAIALCVEKIKGYSFESVHSTDSAYVAMQKMAGNASRAFADTCAHMERETLDRAVHMIMGAKKIEVYGMAGSGFIAEDAAYRLMRIGLHATAISDPIIGAISASHLTDEDVMIIISHTGRTTGMLRVAEIGKGQGARVIGITSYSESPIAKRCDAALIIRCDEAVYFKEAVVSRLGQLLVVDALCAYIGAQLGKDAIERMDEALGFIAEQSSWNI